MLYIVCMAHKETKSPRNGLSKVIRVSAETHRRVREMAKADLRGPGAQAELILNEAWERFRADRAGRRTAAAANT